MQEDSKNEITPPKDEKLERIRDILLGSGLHEVQQQINDIKNQLTDSSAGLSKEIDAVNSNLRSIITKVAVKLNDAIDEIEQGQINLDEETERKILIQDNAISKLQIQLKDLTKESRRELKKEIKEVKKEYQNEILELKKNMVNKSVLVSLLKDLSINISDENPNK